MQKIKELQDIHGIAPDYTQEITPEDDSFKAHIAAWLKKSIGLAKYLLRTHPTDDERANYLTELQKQQEVEKTAALPAQA